LRRAMSLGVAVEPKAAADDALNIDRDTTVGAAQNASASLTEMIAAAARRAREALVGVAKSVSAEMGARAANAASEVDAEAVAQAMFGRDFVFLTRFVPHETAELQSAINYGPTLAPDDEAKRRWLTQAARVRANLGRWRLVELYSGCIGTAPPVVSIAQLPHVEPAKWVALPFADESERPPSGRVALALVRAAQPLATAPWVGLMIDEWTEIIPAKEESTGIAFHYDDPGAEAPQNLLLAVPPVPDAKNWSLAMLLETLNETFVLAKIRAVHGEMLGELGQLLPAAFLAANAKKDTVSVDLTHARTVAAAIITR